MKHLFLDWKLSSLKDPNITERDIRADLDALNEERENLANEISLRRVWLNEKKLRRLKERDLREIPSEQDY